MGPLAHSRRLDAIEAFVADAVAKGATVETGGRRIGNKGYFFEPTVMTNVPRDARIMNEEPFGPVAPIVAFHDLAGAVESANRLPFGLASYVFTRSLSTARTAGEAIQAGMVGINDVMIMGSEMPFGGVKDSGYGSESGTEGVESFMHAKYIRES